MNTTARMYMTAALAVAFLSAGAFAKSDDSAAARIKATNVTVITKTSNWPVKGRIGSDPCKIRTCIEV